VGQSGATSFLTVEVKKKEKKWRFVNKIYEYEDVCGLRSVSVKEKQANRKKRKRE